MKPAVSGACAATSPAQPPLAALTPDAPKPLITSRRLNPDPVMSLLLCWLLRCRACKECAARRARGPGAVGHLLVYMQGICQPPRRKSALARTFQAPQERMGRVV